MTTLLNQTLDKDTPEDQIAALVDFIKDSPGRRDALVELLPEEHPLYRERGTNQVIRLRGYMLAAFEQTGLPEQALPYVLDELENGRDAYLVAAAAKALRGLGHPSGEFVPFLLKAIRNMQYMDDALTFERYKPAWPLKNHTSALQEIFQSFRWLGSQARSALPELEKLLNDRSNFSEAILGEIQNAMDAILASEPKRTQAFVPLSLLGPRPQPAAPNKTHSVLDLELEDQEANQLSYAEFFCQKLAIVVFFYTRCNNPNKCSLTITKLGQLQQRIREEGLEGKLKTAAITYDPDYDLPYRMKSYGMNRGVIFGEDDRFLRAPHGLRELQEYFGLGVNFNGSIVNQHRIELFILDSQGRVVETFARLQWDVREVLDHAKERMRAIC